jgi:hypothetical protein
MFRILIIPCIGIVVLLQFRSFKESKNYNVVERDSSFYIDTNGKTSEYINSNPIINKYEY